MLTREEALAIHHAGPDATAQRLCELSRETDLLRQRVKELEDQVAKNSRNSSKPPSSDGPRKPSPRSLRPRGERKPGGQEGHPGRTLEMTDHPDHTVVHAVDECQGCHGSLGDHAPVDVQRRQVFDVPPPVRIEVTEHQAQIKVCPHCGQLNKAAFPEEVKAPVQYGFRVRAIGTYLREYQLLPSQRTCEMLRDLFACELSEGTLANILKGASDDLEEPVARIAQAIAEAFVAHFDETGCPVNGKRHWLHVACTAELTHYQTHRKRGSEATDEIGILPNFTGRAVHDHWKPYFTYDCDHALCNAHHLRELIFVLEQCGQAWAKEMIDCLLDIKQVVDQTRDASDHLCQAQLHEFETRYQRIIERGQAENPIPPPLPGKKKRGRPKKSKARNLLERLDEYRKETLAFMYDFRVPFDNNQAERDGRMAKVQQKISGTFRSQAGATAFCRIRSYVSTVRKNGINAIEAIRSLFAGRPWLPPPNG